MASAHLDARHFSFSMYTISPFKRLPWCCSSEGISLSRWVCVCVLQEELLWLQQCLPLTQFPLVFAARSCGDLSFWHWNHGLLGLAWSWDYTFLRYPSWIFIYHTWVKDQLVPCMCSSYQSGWMWFFNSIVVRLPFNSISDGSEWWLFSILVVILMWLCKKASHVYAAILTGSLQIFLDFTLPSPNSYFTHRRQK